MGIPQLQRGGGGGGREEAMVRGRELKGGIWQERGRVGVEAARGGGMVSVHWVWSGQVEEFVHAFCITRTRWCEYLKTTLYTGLSS